MIPDKIGTIGRTHGVSDKSKPKPINNINLVNNLTIELGKLGVEIDDPALGIVNFPSLRGIETVFLSYRLGEKSVKYLHEYDENYE